MEREGHPVNLTGEVAEAATILFGNGEADGPEITLAALRRVLGFAAKPHSDYAMAREILTVLMLLPQECKGSFVNGLAGLYRSEETESGEWRKFRIDLQKAILKQQALIQGLELLLRDWRIEEPALKQMDMFSGHIVNRDTGEITT